MRKICDKLTARCFVMLGMVLLFFAQPLVSPAVYAQEVFSTVDSGQTMVESAQSAALDVVVILDQSSSMVGTGTVKATDPNHYRLDAAALMLNMLELNESRIAIVPFNRGIIEEGDWSRFHEVNSNNLAQRKSLTSSLVAATNTRGDTDLGAAMEKAVELLRAQRAKGSSNKPMILLLTDGEIAINNPTTSNGQLYNAEASTRLAQKMAVQCQELGIPIYALALNASSDVKPAWTAILQAMSENTRGYFYEIHNGSELPQMFGTLFGMGIGSQFESVMGMPVEGDPGHYRRNIIIPNGSVEEANLIIPTDGIERLSGNRELRITLRDDRGNVRGTDNQMVFEATTTHYKLIKLIDPTPGIWTLDYYVTGEVGSFTLNLLYNYGVSLRASLDAVAYRNSKLALEAQFYEDGEPSTDPYLYRPIDTLLLENAADVKIVTTYCITDAYNQVVVPETKMAVPGDAADRFTAQLDIGALGLTKLGTYYVKVVASGAGLHRTIGENNELSFELMNRRPGQNAGAMLDTSGFIIHDPRESNPDEPLTRTYALDEIITDPDGETLSYTVTQMTDGGPAVFEIEQDGAMLRISTTGVSGAATLAVTAQDGYGEIYEMAIPLTVVSYREILQVNYDASLAFPNGEPVAKRTESMVEIRLDNNGDKRLPMEPYQLLAMATDATITITGGTRNPEYEEMLVPSFDAAAQTLTASFTTPVVADEYTLNMTFCIGNDAGSRFEAQASMAIGNHAPVPLTGMWEKEVVRDLLIREISFLRFLWANTQTQTIELSNLFDDTDGDGENLRYAVGVESSAAAMPALISIEGSLMTIDPKSSGSVNVSVTATDNDGLSAEYSFHVTVKSITYEVIKWALIIVATIVISILIIRAIVWWLKPSFFDGLEVAFTGGVAKIGLNYIPLGTGKHAISLLSMSEPTGEQDGGVLDMSAKLFFRPAKNPSTVSVCVHNGMQRRDAGNVQVLLGNDGYLQPLDAGTKALLEPGCFVQLESAEGVVYRWYLSFSPEHRDNYASSSEQRDDYF